MSFNWIFGKFRVENRKVEIGMILGFFRVGTERGSGPRGFTRDRVFSLDARRRLPAGQAAPRIRLK